MELTERQTDFSIAIREVANIPDGESWGAFIDLVRVFAKIPEGAESLVHPTEMQKRFSASWAAYAKIWGTEHDRIVADCLGGKEELARVKNHPNGGNVIRQILSRVKEVHGPLTAGMEVVDVNVSDIVAELDEDYEDECEDCDCEDCKDDK